MESVISGKSAQRMVDREIADRVYDCDKLVGIVRMGFGLKKDDDGEYHPRGTNYSSRGVKVQRFNKSPHWCYQLIDPSTGEAVA